MQRPKPTDDYSHGQMMGMLVIIQMLENIKESGAGLSGSTLDKIKRICVEDLAEYFDKPEEDVILMVDQELRDI